MSNPSLLCVPYRFKTSTLYSQIPDSGLGDFSVTRSASNVATRVNAAGVIETVLDNVPRLDYPVGGITAGCPALLVEPAATNSIRNNSMVGAVAGSPGTLPTNYSTGLAGLTQTIVGTGTENGIAYMDIRFNGTSTGGAVVINEETTTAIIAAQGQTWTHSIYAKLIANVLNMPSARIGMYEYTSGGIYLTEGSNTITLTSSLNRFSSTRTLTNASTARVGPVFQWFVNNGTSYDFTVRIGYPQMEQGSVATSVIPTTTAAITRGADVVSKTGVSSLIGQTEGTIYLDTSKLMNATLERFFSIYSSTSPTNDNIIISKTVGNTINLGIRKNNVLSTYVANFSGTVEKLACAFNTASGGVAIYVNGTQLLIDTNSGSFASVLDEVYIGRLRPSVSTDNLYNGRIRAAALYTTRLTNAQLQSLTQ